jgi:hypothetical protein
LEQLVDGKVGQARHDDRPGDARATNARLPVMHQRVTDDALPPIVSFQVVVAP